MRWTGYVAQIEQKRIQVSTGEPEKRDSEGDLDVDGRIMLYYFKYKTHILHTFLPVEKLRCV
jgi:hypothetical protein